MIDLSELDRHEWISTDEFQDVADCLELMEFTLKNLSALSENAIVKSLFVNLHTALSSACVAVLTRTDGGGALQESSEKSLQKYYENQVPFTDPNTENDFPNLKVSSLNSLLKKLPAELKIDVPREWNPDLIGRPLSIWFLIELRNDFIHFKPTNWSVEKNQLKGVVEDGLHLCAAIIANDAVHRRPRFQETNAASLCASCIALIQGLDAWDRPFID